MIRARAAATALGLLLGLACSRPDVVWAATEATESSEGESNGSGDWCAAIAVRPDRRMQRGRQCERIWSDVEVARRADWVMLGSSHDVPESDAGGRPMRCGGPYTHANNARLAGSIAAERRKLGRPPVRVLHMHRFDLVTSSWAQIDGFERSFLVTARTPDTQLHAFFSEDRSPACVSKGCSWDLDRYARHYEPAPRRLRTKLYGPSSNGPRTPVVFYLPRSPAGDTTFGPQSALADLSNATYRRWRVAQAARAVDEGGYAAVMLGHKFSQYRRPGRWLGSSRFPDVEHYVRSKDSVFSAEPRGYGFPEYVQGWTALAAELKAAGVPYGVNLAPNPWLLKADDPSTPEVDESKLILAAARRATVVLLDVSNTGGGSFEYWERRLDREGATVVRINTRCGFAEGEAW